MWFVLIASAGLCFGAPVPTAAAPTTSVPAAPVQEIYVNGVQLHYVTQGSGVAVVFIHGGLADYRRWEGQVEPFARGYRVIAYSRRYNFPNENARLDPKYSAATDAEDLAALIAKLQLGRVHIVGESYGAYVAMILAIRHPEMVRSLVLAEAPVMPWLNASSAGRVAYEDFQQRLWRPVVAAAASADAAKVLAVVAPYYFDGAKFDTLSPKVREQVTANLREWQALGRSSDAFANIRRVDVAAIVAPTLLMEGHNTLALHRILNAQYAALLPNRRLVVIEHATHRMWDEQPVRCREETLQFLAQ